MSNESPAELVWNGGNIEEVFEFMWPEKPRYMGKKFSNADEIVGIATPTGLEGAKIGDTITKSTAGELGVRPAHRSVKTCAAPAATVGNDTAWPLRDVLLRLVEWADHLRDQHNCDCHGYEVLLAAVDAAKGYATAKADDYRRGLERAAEIADAHAERCTVRASDSEDHALAMLGRERSANAIAKEIRRVAAEFQSGAGVAPTVEGGEQDSDEG